MLNKHCPFKKKIIELQDNLPLSRNNYIYVYIRICGRWEGGFWEHGERVDVSHVEYQDEDMPTKWANIIGFQQGRLEGFGDYNDLEEQKNKMVLTETIGGGEVDWEM